MRYGAYGRYLGRGINPHRWSEYALSVPLTIVVIGMLSGIWYLGTPAALVAIGAGMNLCGVSLRQRNETTEPTEWTFCVIGRVAGAVPLTVIAIVGLILASEESVADFVTNIYVPPFLFFDRFASNMTLQHRETVRWRGHLIGQRVSVVPSPIARSALAWQVTSGTLTSPI
ncbi:MAG: heliorhodopsin HeR [Halobacteriota archaeon]